MSAHPSQIYICVAGREAPDWVVERMTTAEIGTDGSFEIEAGDGTTTVKPGFAVFEVEGQVYACLPKLVPEKLQAVTASGNAIVEKLVTKVENTAHRRATERDASRKKNNVLADDYQLRPKPMIGVPPSPQFIPIGELQVDDTYQRSIEGGSSRKLIIKIAENWDWRLCLPLLVSRRNGKLFVIDGQHRKEAAELRGDIPHMPAVVFDFNDPKAEAELFVEANRSRRAMSKLDDFHAAVVAGDQKAIAINEVVTAAGLTVGRNPAWQYWKTGEVIFVGAIQKLLHSQGRPVVSEALGMIGRAFEGQMLVGVGAVFEGLVAFMQNRTKAGSPIEHKLMEMVLSNVGIPGWKEAVEGHETASDRADAMLKAIGDAYAEAEAE